MKIRTVLVLSLFLALSTSLATQLSTPSLFPSVARAHAANRTITIVLVAFVSGWNASSTANPTITVNQGDIVTFKLSAGDTAPHMFALDVDNDGPTFTSSCPTGDTCSSLFTQSSPPAPVTVNTSTLSGLYTYFCTVHSTMQGNFVVVAASLGGTTVSSGLFARSASYLVIGILVAALASAAIAVLARRRSETALVSHL